MANPSFDQFAEMVDIAVDRIPPRFCRDLTGGFTVQEKSKSDGRYITMGQYVEGGHLGCFIVFYYGSFAALLNNQPIEVWQKEILDTVLHEMQHHLESMAGRNDLARQEMAELAQALKGK